MFPLLLVLLVGSSRRIMDCRLAAISCMRGSDPDCPLLFGNVPGTPLVTLVYRWLPRGCWFCCSWRCGGGYSGLTPVRTMALARLLWGDGLPGVTPFAAYCFGWGCCWLFWYLSRCDGRLDGGMLPLQCTLYFWLYRTTIECTKPELVQSIKKTFVTSIWSWPKLFLIYQMKFALRNLGWCLGTLPVRRYSVLSICAYKY